MKLENMYTYIYIILDLLSVQFYMWLCFKTL